ncbi:MAG: hypothetical protein ACRD8Z_28915, partial [Nitrososphaeraceae archaeon]
MMQDLVKAGTEVLGDHFWARFNPIVQLHLKDTVKINQWSIEEVKVKVYRISPISTMLEESFVMLNPLSYKYPRRSLTNVTTRDPKVILKQMEVAFADEISSFYYINLFNQEHESSKDLYSPERLSLLFQDPLIGDWVNKWAKDLSSLY